jgi:Flp pilus assembly protein TadD
MMKLELSLGQLRTGSPGLRGILFLTAVVAACGSLRAFAQESATSPSVKDVYLAGEAALRKNDLQTAEVSFKEVLHHEPRSAGAYSNLGVIAMRREQWETALNDLQQASKLAPQVVGIRLNIGLVYYRTGRYRSAVPAFRSVLHEKKSGDKTSTDQARYLLGLCEFFNAKYREAVADLLPLWDSQSRNESYLYVLSVAAGYAKMRDAEEKASRRLMEIGANSALFHMLQGKAHFNHQQYEVATTEFLKALELDEKLPFAHFSLGLAYLKQGNMESARAEFLKDVALEPDVSYDYDQLGQLALQAQNFSAAADYFRKALQRQPSLATSSYGLARVQQHEHDYSGALKSIDEALKAEPQEQSFHYLRGQLLARLGRTQEADQEFAATKRLVKSGLDAATQQMNSTLSAPQR